MAKKFEGLVKINELRNMISSLIYNLKNSIYTKTETDAKITASKTSVVQSTGTSTTAVMSQKATTDSLNAKANVSHGNHVPTLQTANNSVFLRNDNTWQAVTPGNIGTYTKAEIDSKDNTKANVSHGNHVPAVQTANNAIFLRNDNNWATVTPGNIGAYTKAEVDTKINAVPKITLNNTVTSTSTTEAATANAVKTAYDRGSLGVTNAANAQTTANSKVNKSGDTMTGTLNSSATSMMKSTITNMHVHSNNSLIGFLNNAGSWVFNVNNSGDAIATGNVTAYSDIKLKKDFEVISNALEKINSISGYTYTRKDSGERQAGVIAQEIQKVLPEVVTENKDENGETTLSVAYGNMVALLIEGIKEQQKQIEKLEKVIHYGSTF